MFRYTDIHVYIGMSDFESEGDCVWSDGSPVVYLKYAGSQPDGGTSENCFTMRTYGDPGFFGDIPCTHEKRFLCEVN